MDQGFSRLLNTANGVKEKARVHGTHEDWKTLTGYEPAVTAHLPHAVLPLCGRGDTALEIGCHTGKTCVFLAAHGLKTLGVDINPASIEQARRRAQEASGDCAHPPEFRALDFVDGELAGPFDLVLLIRVLTCFPNAPAWQRCLEQAKGLVRDGGLLYVHDFELDASSPTYGPRYREARSLGQRHGNVIVRDADGRQALVAHHHSTEGIDAIRAQFATIELSRHTSLSMHGNPCRMFRFIGRKQPT